MSEDENLTIATDVLGQHPAVLEAVSALLGLARDLAPPQAADVATALTLMGDAAGSDDETRLFASVVNVLQAVRETDRGDEVGTRLVPVVDTYDLASVFYSWPQPARGAAVNVMLSGRDLERDESDQLWAVLDAMIQRGPRWTLSTRQAAFLGHCKLILGVARTKLRRLDS